MDIYAEITNRIISEMETGIIPWQKPWVASGGCVSYATGKPYSLLNQMLLGRAGEYATYQQVQAAGGYVRKGEKAHGERQEQRKANRQKTHDKGRYSCYLL